MLDIISTVILVFAFFGLLVLFKSLKRTESREVERLQLLRDILNNLEKNNPEKGEDKK